MKPTHTLLAAALIAALAVPSFADDAAPAVKAGAMLRTASGGTIAIYRVAASGEPQVIVEGRIVTVPAATLSSADGRPATSLSLADLRQMVRR